MTAIRNATLRAVQLPVSRHSILDDLIALPGAINSQAGAHPVRSECVRITSAPNNASMILRSGDAGTASPWTYVINDTPASNIIVFCAVSENLNGVANASLTIAPNQYGIFQRLPRSPSTPVPDWAAVVVP